MQTTVETQTSSKTARWSGVVLSALAVLFLLIDAVGKIMNIQPVIDTFQQLELPIELAPSIGILLLVCLIIYLIPPTAILGAILLTGYLGGAIAIQARSGAELFPLLFPVIIGALVWGGLFLRDAQLRTLVPWRR